MSHPLNQERLMSIVLAPHLSEKAHNVAEKNNQMVFKVRRDATKKEIRQAVEMLFEVKVDRVTVINSRGKVKRFGMTMGRRDAWKKAYITLAEGQDIDFLGGE